MMDTCLSHESVTLQARSRVLRFHQEPLIMGILNVTPDSFYDGGRYTSVNRAVDRAKQMEAEGADLIDIGGESTRPGAEPIDEAEELRRVLPVIDAVCRAVTVPVSVDTTKASVARRAIDLGAVIVNDVSALRFDPTMAAVVAETGAGLVLMHMQGTPQTMQKCPHYENVLEEVHGFLRERMTYAESRGISRTQIVLDPGIGFGKLQEHNLDILANLRMLTSLTRPLLIGVSRKAFIGQLLDRPESERVWGTAATVALAVQQGAGILRVHDVGAMRDVVKVSYGILRHARAQG